MSARLAARFLAAGRRVGGGDATPLLARLLIRLREPHRHYHDLGHVAACLRGLDRVAGEAERADEVELALWYHDAVVRPLGPGDDEARSAELAALELASIGVDAAPIARIAAIIVATRDHAPTTGDAALVVDLDLAILGAAPGVFARFEAAIRAEYAAAGDAAYARGRLAVLERLDARRPRYASPVLEAALAGRAAANLAGAIARWRAAA